MCERQRETNREMWSEGRTHGDRDRENEGLPVHRCPRGEGECALTSLRSALAPVPRADPAVAVAVSAFLGASRAVY